MPQLYQSILSAGDYGMVLLAVWRIYGALRGSTASVGALLLPDIVCELATLSTQGQ